MYAYDIFEFIGNIGAITLMITYFFYTMKKISYVNYLILNIISAVLLFINLTVHINLSGIILEVFFILISTFGLIKHHIDNKKINK